MAGRRIVVTGAGSGIGAAVTRRLHEADDTVVAVDLLPPTRRSRIEPVVCDLADHRAVAEWAEALAAGPPVHGLVNVAGLPTTRPAAEILAVNFLALRQLTDRLLPVLTDGGSVVNVASAAGTGWARRLDVLRELLATPDVPAGRAWFAAHPLDSVEAYFLSKEAVTLFTMVACSREIGRGVRVNCVSPGAVNTPILPEFLASMDADRLAELRAHAGGRDGEPDEIAGPVEFLLSDDARWVNGVNLLVDGGAETLVTLGLVGERRPSSA